jgi:hypothetical protein
MDLADVGNWLPHLSPGDWIALGGAVLTLIAVLIALRQLRDSHKIAMEQMRANNEAASKQMKASNQYARGQNWLLFRNTITHYDDIHANFRPQGAWCESRTKPDTVEEWARVELYMGLFEFLEVLMAKEMLIPVQVKDWYYYRIENILQNPRVVKYKLRDNAGGWLYFLKLRDRLCLKLPDETGELAPFIREDPTKTMT